MSATCVDADEQQLSNPLMVEKTASVTPASLTVNVGNAETVYGTPFKESDYDYAYSTETGKSLGQRQAGYRCCIDDPTF